ncbi:peptidylprolyl isomerase [Corallococcus sp. CA031C]|uniref:peptidylprolyl isomerase n=1 Tax=Corallococcus sp. CA031C TaxID=2316725 RepID=UPI000EA2258A|nr:peptidylprolyl isomerase [Corallococcus sp. CA031C]RKH18323.1 peptidylprolyl isomerase [Corallococcus sp. CA031C]
MHRLLGITVALFAVGVLAAEPASSAKVGPWTKKVQAGKDLYATLKTNQGTVIVRLFPKDAPKTVENFVGLATGEKRWTDPLTGQEVNRPLYSGSVFHRVIPGFMIQGGDPTGTGNGDPGYRFEDEFQSGRSFDKPGILAMANAGRNTNGSQFFITTSTPSHLTGRHTIFGEVVSGYDVVEKISNVPRSAQDRPQTPVILIGVTLSDKAPKGVPAAKAPAAAKDAAKAAVKKKVPADAPVAPSPAP